eukprot:Unigene2807_Nuclearia_a/m.8691 Unigene2807_Nuclearia_a/g.8691  ORF Unigene2807_Nuclearia_a/g.8691 Unigene2807_Nuclearia_a/m.8691 type:complete len:105 (-) Unigene2807_Nuclearia_a:353-667(-)
MPVGAPGPPRQPRAAPREPRAPSATDGLRAGHLSEPSLSLQWSRLVGLLRQQEERACPLAPSPTVQAGCACPQDPAAFARTRVVAGGLQECYIELEKKQTAALE